MIRQLFSNEEEIHRCLMEVYMALQRYGYNPVNQLIGYLISGDPTYITAKENARNKIVRLDQDLILEHIIEAYFGESAGVCGKSWQNQNTKEFSLNRDDVGRTYRKEFGQEMM